MKRKIFFKLNTKLIPMTYIYHQPKHNSIVIPLALIILIFSLENLSMSTITCLSGPGFDITGDPFFPGQQIDLALTFDSPTDRALVKLCQWFLNGELIIDEKGTSLTADLVCGRYVAGVRILTDGGWSGIKTLQIQTCKTLIETVIIGAEEVNEGQQAAYFVNYVFSDGSTQDVTTAYVFASTYGAFSSNIYSAPSNATFNDSGDNVTITASGGPAGNLTKIIHVKDASPVILTSLAITGPDSVDEGATADFFVKATYSNGSTIDHTSEYTLFSPAGTFLGNSFRAYTNAVIEQTPRTAEISAQKNSAVQLKKTITINDTSDKLGVLVVDIFSPGALDVIGMFDNTSENEEVFPPVLTAYSGKNIVPSATPASAVILASDLIAQENLKWRFEFNVAKLVADNPNEDKLVFYLKGRGSAEGVAQGSYSLKGPGTIMTLSGHPGSYLPSVTGGYDLGDIVYFSSDIVSGANGSHVPEDLTTIIKLTYHVATRKVSIQTRVKPIPIGDFDFMAIRYHWGANAGTDLDILVGYEQNGTTADNQYVGYSKPATVPANASPQSDSYLWWGLDNRGASGYEGVLVGIRKFITAFPSSPNIVEIALYAVWFGAYLSGDFDIELVTYKGGSMSIVNNSFVNTGGTLVSTTARQLKTQIRNQLSSPGSSFKIGTIKFNKITNTGSIEFLGYD
ncbi:hypothetical protein [Mucilaginibacter psychrotolerans]|uniref:Uncharacterized protein n=1 Tax=Mucilaginibacter psychrotolerans TaxID=1524096 RepID=A0A4Y8S625_9SPHI|nr:hypothetical protein [Mucilaginibacter psychrotolerans]TFF33980.1 hypothetical protein E2R66_23660 [Mucilaginibacter psychrotolerans]